MLNPDLPVRSDPHNDLSDLVTATMSLRRQRRWAAASMALAVLLSAIVAWRLVVYGPFMWHVSIPEAWQGGLEALALAAVFASLQLLAHPRLRIALMVVFALLYLRRHAVDVSLAVDLVYLEITLALGALAQLWSKGSRPRESEDYLRTFVLGLCVWSALAWTLSACGLGTATYLRWLTLLCALALPLARTRPLSVHLGQRFADLAPSQRALAAALVAWFLVLFARSRHVTGFDGLWYGFRGEYMLTGGGSAYQSLGLVSPVHYFPKLYELYLQPVSGLGALSAISGVTILIAALLGIALTRLTARLGLHDQHAQLLVAIVCLSLPAVANPALDPKPDVLGCLLVVLACLCACDWLQSRRWPALAWLAACALLATQAKLTTIPFIGLLIVATAISTYLRRASTPETIALPRGTALLALTLASVVTVFVTTRTLLLAGVPTIGPDPLLHLWLKLGFQLREPAGTLTWSLPQDWTDLPTLIVDWLFRPDKLEHIIITWTGNVWLWLPAMALAIGWRFHRHSQLTHSARAPAFALVLASVVIALGWGYMARGGDGNYFMAGVVAAISSGVAWLWPRVAWSTPLRRSTILGLLVFALFQSGYAFLSAGWITGTLAADLEFKRSPRQTRVHDKAMFAYAGIARIADYLRMQHSVPRVVGCAEFSVAARLPAQFEDPWTISFSRPYADSSETLLAYMRRFNIPYLLLRHATPQTRELEGTPEGAQLAQPHGLCAPDAWTPDNATLVVDDDAYRLYRVY